MAPTIKWQRWDTASYNWFDQTAGAAFPALVSELSAWITTVNGNASNTGRQLTLMRDHTDSTSTANTIMFTLRAGANSNTKYGYMQYGSYASTTVKNVVLGNVYADDTTRNGYGTVSGLVTSDTSISHISSGQDFNSLIITGTVDGEEYFIWGPHISGTTYQDGFYIVKATTGEWVMGANDGAVHQTISYFNDSVTTDNWAEISRGASGSSVTAPSAISYSRLEFRPYAYFSSSLTGLVGPGVYAASADLYCYANTSEGDETGDRRVLSDLGNGTNVYMLTSMHYGPTVLVDLRP